MFVMHRMRTVAPVLGAASLSLLALAPAQAADNSFNPAVSLILSGTYSNLSKDPGTWHLSGFQPTGGEVGPGSRSFNLGESELGLSASIDQLFFGQMTLAISPENEAAAEEAFVQTTALPHGLTLRMGRFYSALGYLNDQHAHTWDFVDAPLVHQAFFGGQFKQEGVQLKWLAPTDQFIELGAELGNGRNFPGNDRNRNGGGAINLSAHSGGDVGDSHNWRAGMSFLRTQATARSWDETDVSGNTASNAFTGNSQVLGLDGVWKWAPQGNATVTSFKLQGEVFRRVESGSVAYDTAGANTLGGYRASQSGWYLQGVYQFMPQWRVGLRHDQLDSGNVAYGSNATNLVNTDYSPKRDSVMLDWSASEFSRIRVQLNSDRARQSVTDRQVFIQYQMSLGAHGAHSY
jgi:hypothetical protein